MSEWKFSDPPNVAVFIDRKIANGEDWIAQVFHDLDDGAWQFHTADTQKLREEDALLISLRKAVQLDPSIINISDLPLGWRAWRETRDSTWQRAKI